MCLQLLAGSAPDNLHPSMSCRWRPLDLNALLYIMHITCTSHFSPRRFLFVELCHSHNEDDADVHGYDKRFIIFISSLFSQSHYRRALALSGLGRVEESFIAYCVSICLDKRSENVTNALRYDLSRVSLLSNRVCS